MTDDEKKTIRETLLLAYDALKEKGYNPVDQLVGFLCSDDASYLTVHRDARRYARRYDQDEYIEELLRSYLGL